MKGCKRAKSPKYPAPKPQTAKLQDALSLPPKDSVEEGPMIRTQIYLSRREHDFVQSESSRLGKPIAAIIREFIDQKMELPDDVWTNNPMLQPVAHDPSFKGHEDGALNHDFYVYGTPKRYMKRRGKWVETPPLPDDYYKNPESRAAYDEMVNREE